MGLLLAYAHRVAPNAVVRDAVRSAGLGYALPGTVLALGLIIPLAAFDNRLDALLRASLGISSGLLLSGSLFVIVLAYTIRFLAVALSALEGGLRPPLPQPRCGGPHAGRDGALGALARAHPAAGPRARRRRASLSSSTP